MKFLDINFAPHYTLSPLRRILKKTIQNKSAKQENSCLFKNTILENGKIVEACLFLSCSSDRQNPDWACG
jgi:hypothetical protein